MGAASVVWGSSRGGALSLRVAPTHGSCVRPSTAWNKAGIRSHAHGRVRSSRPEDNGQHPVSHPLPWPLADTVEEMPEPERTSRVRVERQAYIHLPKAMLASVISSREELTPKQRLGLRRVLACLESIYGVEYQLAGDRLVQTLHRLNRAVVVPPGVKLVASSVDESNALDWDEEEDDWNREPSLHVEVKAGMSYMSAQEAEQLERSFFEGFMVLVGKSHFIPVSSRDCVMADTFNTSYLAQLFIRPNLNCVDADFCAGRAMEASLVQELGGVAVFKRGWGKERTTGQLLAPKLDFVQSLIAKSLVRMVQGPLVSLVSALKGGSASPSSLGVAPATMEARVPEVRSAGPLMLERGTVASLRPGLSSPSSSSPSQELEEPRFEVGGSQQSSSSSGSSGGLSEEGRAGACESEAGEAEALSSELRWRSPGPLEFSRGSVSALRPAAARSSKVSSVEEPEGEESALVREVNGSGGLSGRAAASSGDPAPSFRGAVEEEQRKAAAVEVEKVEKEQKEEKRFLGGRVLLSLRRSLEYYGLLPPSDKVELCDFEEQFPVKEAKRHSPVYVERVSIEDCFGAAKQPAGPQTVKSALDPRTLFGQVELVEPTFREVLVICRPKTPMQVLKKFRKKLLRAWVRIVSNQEVPEKPVKKERMHMRVYKDIPVPVWRIVHPFKAIAFRPISMLKVDLVALAGIVAILAQAKYGSPLLSLVWIGSLAAQGLRVVLQYRRMFIQFDNYVSKQMLNRTVAGSDGVPEFLARSAALQQYKQVLLLYYTLLAHGGDMLMEPEAAVSEIEGILSSCGCEVDFNITEAKAELLRLGLLRFAPSGPLNGSGPVFEVLPPDAAVERLMEHWNSILLDQLEDIGSSEEDIFMPDNIIDSLDDSEEESALSTYEAY